MAKQVGPFTITGCYDTICFYKMDGVYYARMKSSLTGKRVKKDPAFGRTMEYAGLLGQASRIASALYRDLPINKKEKGLFRTMTGQVIQLLKEGKTKEEVLVLMGPAAKEELTPTASRKKIIETVFPFAEEILYRVFSSSPVSHETGIATCFKTGPPEGAYDSFIFKELWECFKIAG